MLRSIAETESILSRRSQERSRARWASVDGTNLWAGLGEDDDIVSTMAKGQEGINSWGNNLLAVGGELRPDKCSYTVHEMRLTGDGEWRYVQEVVNKTPPAEFKAGNDGVDELWEINAEVEDQEMSVAKITVPLIGSDAVAIKKLTAQESEKTLGCGYNQTVNAPHRWRRRRNKWKSGL